MTRSLRPSCLRTRESAAKRLSLATRRLTKLDRIVRETIKEHNDPAMVAEAIINQLRDCFRQIFLFFFHPKRD